MKTASFGWIVICVGAFAVIISILLSTVTIQTPKSKSPNASEKPSPSTCAVTDAESDLTVSPSGRLDIFIRQYEETVIRETEPVIALAEFRMTWQSYKRNGGTLWGSEEWMKEPDYYKGLETKKLAEECFERRILAGEMDLFDNPVFGLERVRIMHNGFAELFGREDMYEGIIHVFGQTSEKLADPKSDFPTICKAAYTLHGLSRLCFLSPLKEQVKGREDVFFKAYLQGLKSFKAYLDNYDPQKMGGAIGFYVELCTVVDTTLVFQKQLDSEKYERILPAIRVVRWPREQRVQDLKSYVDLVIASLEGDDLNQQ